AYYRAVHAEIATRILFAAALAATAGPPIANAAPVTQPLNVFRACLAMEDMTKERLDCFDAIVRPDPKPITERPSAIADCRFYKDEDERLRCFNSFLVAPAPTITPRSAQQTQNERFLPCYVMDEMTKERLDCFDAIVPPTPTRFTAQPKSILECR